MSMTIKFFTDFSYALDHYDGLVVIQGITGEYTSHPKDIEKIMIDRLKEM